MQTPVNKPKVYLDTSVVSYLDQTDAPEHNNSTEIKEPVLSPRFDVDDIRKLREYNSLRHINMTAEEYIAELKADTSDIINQLLKSGHAHRISRY